MPRFEIDIDPCDHLTADAIGSPGQRVFYLQAYQEQRTITILIEKAQLQSLAIGIEQFLSQINQQNPNLEEARGEFSEDQMRIHPPVDPLFRAGEIGLGYDKDRDRVVIFTKELLTEEEDPDRRHRSAFGQAAPRCANSRAGAQMWSAAAVPFVRSAASPKNPADISARRRTGI
ncbi:DUF3090 family protein [Candidatus Villigracilis affinis]|uniref:DUF3090 family protein n=1 Tax=Candidatus Villigracilis affinis TaxID=3140682 RepID=UPI002A22D33C|nr:DUF3090 family protein [Anaerolineales bacterium]